MNNFIRLILFFLFFLSGFCGLVYQVVWTRMAFASFGIIMPVLSVVLSVFMSGLFIGSWAGGRWILALVKRTGISAVFFYAGAELLIGLGAFVVPKLFAFGEYLLLSSGETNSFRYLFLSALVLAVSIVPWCVCMGTTFPFMMAYIREREEREVKSFSFLYLANVLGAMCGTFMTAVVWIEVWGLQHTLWLAAAGNFTIAVFSFCLGWERRRAGLPPETAAAAAKPAAPSPTTALRGGMTKWILFSTGFIAMAMEVVWTRAFTPVLKTQVYSFAMIVFTYLGATFLGSLLYRRHLRTNRVCSTAGLLSALAIAVFFPVLANDSRFVVANWLAGMDISSAILLLASICPVCALLGYLTPGLIDEYASGHPVKAGRAYAINVLGCILGPLFAGYVLLPHMRERHALIVLGLPFLVFYLLSSATEPRWRRATSGLLTGGVLAVSLFLVRDFETTVLETQKHTVVRRDYAASVISFGEARDKHLLVNGIGMTSLTPITKFMVHLPMVVHHNRPESALIICFGMGTSYRSALSWNVDTTAVELVPSVTKAFGFYHADAAQFIDDTNGHIVTDDGRRFLKRTSKKYDVIVVDPPPPAWATGSSLLYSTEFYALARQHLNPGGILQMWYPGGELATGQAVVRSLDQSFPHVRCFRSVEGWGIHLLASSDEMDQLNADQLVERMPPSARQDLLEWKGSRDATAYLGLVISNEAPVQPLLNPDPEVQITDDQPFNEYYLLRTLLR